MIVNVFKFYFSITGYSQYFFGIRLWGTAQWLDNNMLYKVVPPTFAVHIWHHA